MLLLLFKMRENVIITCYRFHYQESNQFGNVNMNDCTVTVLYTKYDLNQLSATINSSRASKIITSEKNTHLFKTEDNRK